MLLFKVVVADARFTESVPRTLCDVLLLLKLAISLELEVEVVAKEEVLLRRLFPLPRLGDILPRRVRS